MNKNSTTWGPHAQWYDTMVHRQDSYQQTVILPNLLRIVSPRKGQKILDLACGQGFFSNAFYQAGSTVMGDDIAPELITLAREHSPKEITYHSCPAHNLPFEASSFDVITIVLAIQNIKEASEVIAECARVLRPAGRLVMVLNHPCFRIPQKSDWGWDAKANVQYRRIDGYMGDFSTNIQMHPGEDPRASTISFHRPLQWYVKALSKQKFALTRLEEWISNKKSQKGPRSIAENIARKEFPLFLCLEATLYTDGEKIIS